MTEPELTRLVECVPNVSEGRRPEVVEEIVRSLGIEPDQAEASATSSS